MYVCVCVCLRTIPSEQDLHRNLKMSRVPASRLPASSVFILLCVVSVLFSSGVSMAMKITSTGPQTLQLALGDQKTLSCTYTPGPEDVGDLDIEWTMVSPDTTQKDKVFLSFSGGNKYYHGDPAFLKGVDFAVSDPSLGDASLSIAELTAAHTGTYQCKVKKAPGLDMRKITLLILERPSVPKCWLEGDEGVGTSVSLRCRSDQGTPPIQYVWRRESGGPIPSTVTQDPFLGDLFIANHSLELAGIYTCEVSNAVGKERCRINLQATKPPNRAGVIAGVVSGCLLLICIIIIILLLLFFRCRSQHRRYEKEFSNEIREDVPAPESRPTSRVSSLHSRAVYSQMNQSEQHQVESSSTGYTLPKYHNKYGYIV
ncbi:V-set and immunoglobulin domain-containing protein 8a [Tachysurus vachellii]|uniref:V-set and immunoglobulin domain-containing protein 8a n=1 Tax=Tachysurus vachellii TaxID=175792 RepID=UPI00296ABE1F|nr:V-set and immunoglobulin domain-containing protein 8a [Tachysurus vachellii]